MYKNCFLVLFSTALVCVCGNSFLYCNFFTDFKVKDNYFYANDTKLFRQTIDIFQKKEKTEKVVFVFFYKKDSRGYLDFTSLEHLAQEMAKYVAGDRHIFLQLVPLEYERESFLGRQLYQNAANQLVTYLIDNQLVSQKNQKLLLYTVSDSMDSVALATHDVGLDKILPKNSIHTILALDAEASVTPNFEKIKHRLYGLYGKKGTWRKVSLWKQFFEPRLGSEKKTVNVRCLYEKVSGERVKAREIVHASFYDLFTRASNRAFTKLIKTIDETYCLTNDLTAVLFSERSQHWREVLPLVFMNNLSAYTKREREVHDKTIRALYNYVTITKKKNPELFNILALHKVDYDGFLRESFVSATRDLGVNHVVYKPDNDIVGPFFVRDRKKLYVTVLAKRFIADDVRIEIGDWAKPKQFEIKASARDHYVVLKKNVADYSDCSYEITLINDSKMFKGIIPGS
ncbi:hypothetical protein KKA53_00980 [Candidatus Dependentiae bacterium]|nr:hypothetical protein [Candidatus Dependentiae bacterium]